MTSPSTDTRATWPVVEPDAVGSLRAAVLMLARRMRYQGLGEELTPSEMAVLGRLQRGPATPGALARSEHMQPPSMTRLLERLESKGFVQRTPDPNDRRQVVIDLTDAAHQHILATRAARSAWLSGQLDDLDPADVDLILAAAPALLRLAECP